MATTIMTASKTMPLRGGPAPFIVLVSCRGMVASLLAGRAGRLHDVRRRNADDVLKLLHQFGLIAACRAHHHLERNADGGGRTLRRRAVGAGGGAVPSRQPAAIAATPVFQQ